MPIVTDPTTLFRSLRVSLALSEPQTQPDQRVIALEICADDGEPFNEWTFYDWRVRLTIGLVGGELRRAWSEGNHDDSNLEDNWPRAQLCVPWSRLREPLRVRIDGYLRLWDIEDHRDGARIDFGGELDVPSRSRELPLGSGACEPPIGAFEGSATAGTPRCTALELEPLGHVVACLPGVGLVERLPGRHGGYRLLAPTGAIGLSLPALFEALPGRASWTEPVLVGGPGGKLAIHVVRDGALGGSAEHLLVVELPTQRLVMHVPPSPTRTVVPQAGFFDAGGERYVCILRDPPRVITAALDLKTGEATARWRTSLSQGVRCAVRWHLEDDVLWAVGQTFRQRCARDEAPENAALALHPDARASAYHPAPEVAAWALRDGSVLCAHPTWGAVQRAAPEGPVEEVVVLRDGRVLARGERLFVLEPEHDRWLGLSPALGPLEIEEAGAEIVAWTRDPRRWRIAVPSR
jgi:hypothetical protein